MYINILVCKRKLYLWPADSPTRSSMDAFFLLQATEVLWGLVRIIRTVLVNRVFFVALGISPRLE
jgi:hypothetical protein